ncbi:hypothetical protein PtA15_8A204 [Puccinia triticina]|uniref:F-box domain-containing protein n=1 Tax=Puccinia triticina TaxID=208348 RepID=A0ABY7CRI8_9BASI|nr:uncharacterized protein PtA15_8A204 [Puccinia triticina]WAQ87300.1 hypothetical protein PtA15_8A204 [Puccinia triticina]WAR57153.1 hypothetical protein PtB15_8B199 [Puccinia triticina]
MRTKAKYWLKRLGPDQQLDALRISVSSSWPQSTICHLLTFLAPNACLRSFTFHAGNLYGIKQKTFSDLVAFAYSNRATLLKLELQVPNSITCPLTLPAFLSDFPSLKELKLQGQGGESLLFIQSKNFHQNYVLSSKSTLSELVSPDSNHPSASCHAQPHPIPLKTGHRPESVLDQQLETLFAHSVAFVPSEAGPINLSSLRSLSLISADISAMSPDNGTQSSAFNRYMPGIDFVHLPKLENLELCGRAVRQEQWGPVGLSLERLPKLRRLRLERVPHFIPHFLELANVPLDWSPEDDDDQPFRVAMEAIFPELEFISLFSLNSYMSYEFLAIFGFQFSKLDSLSVAGLRLDSETEPLLIRALQNLPPLMHLDLSNTDASPGVIDAIKPGRLRNLRLTNCSRVTFRPLIPLAKPKKLQLLDIMGCPFISERDMIEWLSRRVKVLNWEWPQYQESVINGRAEARLYLD